VSVVTRALVVVLLALGLVPGLLPGPGIAPAANAVTYHKWGRAAAPDQRLRAGCQDYRYHYRVHAPSHDWLIEVFLLNRKGAHLGYENYSSESPDNDPERGHGVFNVCRQSTVPGRHTLKMRVTWYDPNDLAHTPHRGWVRPTHFRLYR
jgi:hypothetical protein